MSAELVASSEELARVAPEWEALAERLAASPFLFPGWVEAWARAFGRGRLAVRVLRRAGRLVALAPVLARRGALASPTNWHSPESGWLAESPEAEAALLDALLAEGPRRLSFAFLDPRRAEPAGARARARGYRVLRRTLQSSPCLALEGGWEAYSRGLGKNLRGDLARRRRKLAALGAMTIEVSDGESLEERLAEGFRVEASSWKGSSGTAIDSDEASRRFYTEVARWAAARGWLRLAFLRLDGRALAFDYCLEHAGVHYMLKTGYDPAQRELSPGKVLREAMIQRAFEQGLRSYELLGAAEPWKLQWTSDTRPRELVQLFRPSPLGLADWTLFRYGRPLAKKLRDRARTGLRRGARTASGA